MYTGICRVYVVTCCRTDIDVASVQQSDNTLSVTAPDDGDDGDDNGGDADDDVRPAADSVIQDDDTVTGDSVGDDNVTIDQQQQQQEGGKHDEVQPQETTAPSGSTRCRVCNHCTVR